MGCHISIVSQLILRSDGIKYASNSHGQVKLYATFCPAFANYRWNAIQSFLFFRYSPFVRQKYHDEAYTECNNVVPKVVTGLHFTLAVSQRMCRGAL
jgi:hypothetical protein